MLITQAESLQLHNPTQLFSLPVVPACDLFKAYNKYLRTRLSALIISLTNAIWFSLHLRGW